MKKAIGSLFIVSLAVLGTAGCNTVDQEARSQAAAAMQAAQRAEQAAQAAQVSAERVERMFHGSLRK